MSDVDELTKVLLKVMGERDPEVPLAFVERCVKRILASPYGQRVQALNDRVQRLEFGRDQAREYIRQIEAENDRLREALEALRDVQNGSPLIKYENAWNEAMRLTDAALGRAAPEGKAAK